MVFLVDSSFPSLSGTWSILLSLDFLDLAEMFPCYLVKSSWNLLEIPAIHKSMINKMLVGVLDMSLEFIMINTLTMFGPKNAKMIFDGASFENFI